MKTDLSASSMSFRIVKCCHPNGVGDSRGMVVGWSEVWEVWDGKELSSRTSVVQSSSTLQSAF